MSVILPYGPEFANHPLRDPFYFPEETPHTFPPSLLTAGPSPRFHDFIKREWMAIPQQRPKCPQGLESLAFVDQLLVHQRLETLDVFGEWNNRYIIRNDRGETVYEAREVAVITQLEKQQIINLLQVGNLAQPDCQREHNCCSCNCPGYMCPLILKVRDYSGFPGITIHRKSRCDSCCCPCCLQSMEVRIFGDTVVGRVKQEWSLLRPSYRIEDAEGETMFRITGPTCISTCCGNVKFLVLSTDGKEVGTIMKLWSGTSRDIFTDADQFAITFPIALNVKMKAVLLGALFQIDINYFQRGE